MGLNWVKWEETELKDGAKLGQTGVNKVRLGQTRPNGANRAKWGQTGSNGVKQG